MILEMHIGDEYHRSTKHVRGKRHNRFWDWKNPPPVYKTYENSLKIIPLPEPEITGGKPLFQTINERRSCRNYSLIPMNIKELSQLLWATQGISAELDGSHLRTAPSAGALYPIDTYLVVNNIERLEKGVYHYNVPRHALEMLREGDFRKGISEAALNQNFLEEAGVVFVWTAVVQRTKWKYGERGYRYIYKDAAHICANLYLAATSLDLGCCAIGACYDDEVDELLGIDGEEEITVYLAAVGKKA
jgi:SagB-type dehydrogenase family enzyme